MGLSALLPAYLPLLPHREKKQEETANWFWGVELPSPGGGGGGGGGGGSGHGGVERRPGLPTCGLEGPFPPNHLPSSLLFLQHDHKDEKTLFLEKKHLFHHNQCSGEPKKQGFFRSWRKVAMISTENYFLEFDIGGHLSQI